MARYKPLTITEMEKDAVIHYKIALIGTRTERRSGGDWIISNSKVSRVFISKS